MRPAETQTLLVTCCVQAATGSASPAITLSRPALSPHSSLALAAQQFGLMALHDLRLRLQDAH